MNRPDYTGTLKALQGLSGPIRDHVELRMAQEQAQGRNPLEWLQQTMTPKPRQYIPGSYTSGVRG